MSGFDSQAFRNDLSQAYAAHRQSHPGYYIGRFEPDEVAENTCRLLISGGLSDLSSPIKMAMRKHGIQNKRELLTMLRSQHYAK